MFSKTIVGEDIYCCCVRCGEVKHISETHDPFTLETGNRGLGTLFTLEAGEIHMTAGAPSGEYGEGKRVH